MSLSENDKRVLRLIKVGAENSITGAEISLITKLAERTVQDIISRLITRHSVPIVGVRHGTFRGYFIPANKEELLDGAKTFYNQIREEEKRLAVLMNSDLESYKETLKEVGGYVSLSRESEQDLAHGILEVVERYLEARDRLKPRLTGLISAQEVMDELDIKYMTLQKWEKAGLRRYHPPLEDTRKVYYKITDIWKFLGVENG